MNDLHKQLPGLVAAVHTADGGSFSAAARQLGLTPAAVGKSVAHLEAHLGVRLFNRTTRTLALTAEGERVVAQARLALDALAGAGEVARADQGLSGLVRISCASGFGRAYVLPLVGQLLLLHPALRIQLSMSDLSVDLVREGFDIGIRGGLEPPQGMVAQRLYTLPKVLVATPAYLKKNGVPADWSGLVQHRLIGLKFLSGRNSLWAFRSQGKNWAYDPPAALLLSSPEAVLDAVLLHQGIAQVGLHHAWQALSRGQLQPLLKHQHVPGEVPLSVFYPHRSGLAPRVRAVVDHLVTALRAHPELAARRVPEPRGR